MRPSPGLSISTVESVVAATTLTGARQAIGRIQSRLADMQLIGRLHGARWLAAEEAWQLEVDKAEAVMAERGWL